jgi:hypothetical protein
MRMADDSRARYRSGWFFENGFEFSRGTFKKSVAGEISH